MQITQGSLAIVDGNVFWKGQFVLTESLMYHHDGDTKMVGINVRNGDEAVLADMEAAGIRVRRLK